MFGGGKQKALVGLDIGSSSIKAVELKSTKQGYELVSFGLEALAQDTVVDGAIMDAPLVAGAISNIFIEKDGQWFTPPIECGLLAGVQRRNILEMQPNVQEQVLYPQDLRQADAIYLSNAVRGLRPAVIDWENSAQSQAEA